MSKSSEELTIVAINRTMRLALLSDHATEVPFDQMFDADGDETDDVEEAISCIIEMPDGTWRTLDLTAWEKVTLH